MSEEIEGVGYAGGDMHGHTCGVWVVRPHLWTDVHCDSPPLLRRAEVEWWLDIIGDPPHRRRDVLFDVDPGRHLTHRSLAFGCMNHAVAYTCVHKPHNRHADTGEPSEPQLGCLLSAAV